MALDPTGLTTLDAWQPDKEGRLLAYQLSVGGDEESRPLRHRRGDGRAGRGPDRPVPLLPRSPGCPAARPSTTCAGCRAPRCPRTRGSSTAASICTGSAPPPRTTSLIFGDGMKMTNYYGVSVSRDGRWLQISAGEGTAPRNDLWVADLDGSDRPSAGAERRAGGRGRPDRPALRPRRPALRAHRPRRPARPGLRHRPGRPGHEPGAT